MALTLKSAALRQRMIRLATGGAASIIFAAICSSLLRIVSSVTLTRLLDVNAFGIVAIVTSVAFVFQLVSDIGVQPFIIRHARGDDPIFLDEIWTLRLIRSVILTLIMAASAGVVAKVLGKPEFALVIMVYSLSFTFDGLSSMSFATSVRERKLWRLAILDLSTSIAQFIVAVILAVIFRSYWSILFAMLAASALKVLLSYTMFPHSVRRLRFSRDTSREMWNFSRFIAPSSLMTVFILQSDKLILARMMPISVFGLYALSTTISTAGPALASNYGRRVLFPVYAEAVRAGSQTLRQVFYRTRRWQNLFYMLAMGGICGGAGLIVALLYDPRYQGVVVFLRILSIGAAFVLVSSSSEEMIIALGHLRNTIYATFTRLAWLATGTVLTFIFKANILYLVAVFGTAEVVAAIFWWTRLHKEKLLDFREEAAGVLAVCAGAAIGFGMSWIILHAMAGHASLHDLLRSHIHMLH